jgi:hypothetical protein
MKRRAEKAAREILEEWPSWTIPALIGAAILTLSGVFLYYYFGPSVDELMDRTPRATSRTHDIKVQIADSLFVIPANFTRFGRGRSDGRHEQIELHALLPEMEPFTEWNRDAFEDLGPSSKVIQFEIGETGNMLDAERRFAEVYLKFLETPRGEPAEFGLTRYLFNRNTGYEDQELFAQRLRDGKLFLLMCFRKSSLIPAPHCTRTILLSEKLGLTYRYKKAHLADWQTIDTKMIALVDSLRSDSKGNSQGAFPALRLKPAE